MILPLLSIVVVAVLCFMRVFVQVPLRRDNLALNGIFTKARAVSAAVLTCVLHLSCCAAEPVVLVVSVVTCSVIAGRV